MKYLFEIIKSIDSDNPNINPTEIYNEGWMTRLLVYESIKEKIKLRDIDFKSILYWTSEALISNPFIKDKEFKEGYTHADMALGDFSVDFNVRGEIKISENAKIFGIIEAKMGSNLSQGTKYCKEYNQISRNLACIAYNTYNKDCEIFLYAVAPETKIKKHKINEQIEMDYMINQIIGRYNKYPDVLKKKYLMDLVISKARKCKAMSISYEEWLEKIKDNESREFLDDFYKKSKRWNRIDKIE